jgi:hypothetical protein
VTIQEIYEKYSTPANLREHMLRVASLSKIILENWTGELPNSKAVIIACALHDIAKPVNFDIEKQIEFGVSPTDIYSLENLQHFIKKTYGTNEHAASIGMAGDVGADKETLGILRNIEWSLIPDITRRDHFGALISIYCDMRIGPFGILSITERLKNLEERRESEDWEIYFKLGEELEQKIKENTSIDLQSLTDRDLSNGFDEILALEV